MDAPRLIVREFRLYERDVNLRMPFRFGAVTMFRAEAVFVRARIEVEGVGAGWGMSSEMLAPKWFNKSPDLSEVDTVDELRRSLALAMERYVTAAPARPFDLYAESYPEQLRAGKEIGMPPLAASFGLAVLDRAVLDALCRVLGLSLAEVLAANMVGLTARLTPDLGEFDLSAFLASKTPLGSVAARHTVGLLDPLTAADQRKDARIEDGLPETLDEVIRVNGVRYFKIKIGGDVAADVERLRAIAAVLDGSAGEYRATLDGNEQYGDVEALTALISAIRSHPALGRLRERLLYVEQPLDRDVAADLLIGRLAGEVPFLIDESDGDVDAFSRYRALGYDGVSVKGCKGVYKALLNAARCVHWNGPSGRQRYFLSAEDLSCQAGLGVQQDLALTSWLGIPHCERNGHHYVFGMRGVPESEQAAFIQAYPDLYRRVGGTVCLAIRAGEIDTVDLHRGAGWASLVEPDWSTLRPCGGFER